MAHTKATRYPVTGNIVYHGPGPLNGTVVKPGDPGTENGLPFAHLDDGDIALLQKKGYLGQAIVKESK